jgi:hypothetical protein
MKYISELKPAAVQPRPNAKAIERHVAKISTQAEKWTLRVPPPPGEERSNYERYLALAHAEALAGDRIVAENYFQHAEHYFRSMAENPN